MNPIRQNRVSWTLASTVALAALLAAEAPALAQSDAAAAPPMLSTSQIEDIVVTARRREESAQKTPLSVSAISGQQLQNLNIVRMEGIAQLAPSLRVTQASGSGNAPAIYIRGIGTLSTALYVEPAGRLRAPAL